uniref:MarR family winged helix-turn-helix transcriptional regulator n=1 Tax=uncultured Sphingomonas sp. TaxID=158754 RepID=UPI0035CB92C3
MGSRDDALDRPPPGEVAVPEFSIPFRISWIARLQRARFDSRARSLGLTRAQWRVIATIRLREGLSQTDVASQLEVSNVTAGRILDRLEEQKWIERRPHPEDRRSRQLYLTPAAAPMLDLLSDIGADEESVALAGLSGDEREVLSSLLVRIIANMAEAPDLVSNEREAETAQDFLR